MLRSSSVYTVWRRKQEGIYELKIFVEVGVGGGRGCAALLVGQKVRYKDLINWVSS